MVLFQVSCRSSSKQKFGSLDFPCKSVQDRVNRQPQIAKDKNPGEATNSSHGCAAEDGDRGAELGLTDGAAGFVSAFGVFNF